MTHAVTFFDIHTLISLSNGIRHKRKIQIRQNSIEDLIKFELEFDLNVIDTHFLGVQKKKRRLNFFLLLRFINMFKWIKGQFVDLMTRNGI